MSEFYYNQPSYTIKDCNLYLTCGACPEQYDVFYNGNQIGYLRLRHGNFSVSYPDVGGKIVMFASPKGDGMFYEDERMPYLEKAINALLNEHQRNEKSN